MKELRKHQSKTIQLLRDALASGSKRPMVQLPTGAGKTVVAAKIVAAALEKGNRVMFVVPAISLINQTAESFAAEGITDIGIVQSDHPLTNYEMPVQIASVQTIIRRKSIPPVNLVIVDEAHRHFEGMTELMEKWNALRFIGLSATPWTRGLSRHYDRLIIGATCQSLIDDGYLADFKVFAPSHPDLSNVKTVAGDYHEGQLAEVMGEAGLVSSVVQNWKDKGEGRPTLCFAVDRAHAAKLQKDFLNAGVPSSYIDANTPVEERELIARKFSDGEIKVVCNVGCLTTGIDWDVRCIILARPTRSEMLYVQMIGRGLRTAPGKDHCLILDHSDTTLRLGFVTDIHHSELDDGKPKDKSKQKEREEPLPSDCSACGFVKPPKTPLCPSCGFKSERQSKIEEKKGELSELKRKNKLNRTATTDQKRDFYGELRAYAAQKNFKQGWANHKYREKFGVWPNAHSNAPLRQPSKETLGWITSRNIARSKGRAA